MTCVVKNKWAGCRSARVTAAPSSKTHFSHAVISRSSLHINYDCRLTCILFRFQMFLLKFLKHGDRLMSKVWVHTATFEFSFAFLIAIFYIFWRSHCLFATSLMAHILSEISVFPRAAESVSSNVIVGWSLSCGMSWFACLYGCSSHNTKETPTDPLSFLFPSFAEFVGQMSVKSPHLKLYERIRSLSYLETLRIQKLLAVKWIGSAGISTFEFGVKWEQLCCVTTGSHWNCGIVQVYVFKITAKHHVKFRRKLCLHWLAKGLIVSAPTETHTYIHLSRYEWKTTHLKCICAAHPS